MKLRWSTGMFGIALSLALVPPAQVAQAQAVGTVRGRVVEAASKQGIADAQLSIVGTGSGALSNTEGEFVIAGVAAGARTVRIRRIGFAPAERTVTVVAGQEVRLDIELATSATQLSALVVTGTAGAAERRTVGNSITTLNVAEATERSNIISVSEVLQSKTPGVTLLPGSGVPGTSGEFRIRGTGSISGYRPVVFIDGVRYNTDALATFPATGAGLAGLAQSTQVTSALDFLNPDDIESVEVVKGPAAATLYGADAANGVIQIITKKGARGQQQLRWNMRAERGQSEWLLRPDNNYTFCDAAKQAARETNGTPTWPGCQGIPVNSVITDNPLFDDPQALRTGDVTRMGVNVRGGGDRYSFFISGDRDIEQGVFFNSDNARKSVRTNFSFNPNEKADFALNVNWQDTKLRLPMQDESAAGLLLSSVRGRPGRVSVLDSRLNEGWRTILPARANGYKNFTQGERLTMSGTLNYNPLAWFRNRVTLGLDNTTSQAQLLFLPGDDGEPAGANAQRTPITRVITLDYSGNFLFDFLGGNLTTQTSIGSQVVGNKTETLAATGTGLGAPDVTLIGLSQVTSGSNAFSENNSVGYYVQEQLGWKNRLYLTAAVRADDNSSFGTNFDLIVYPKFSLSWVLTEEPMVMGLLEKARVNSFKLRSAWGQAGRAPAPYSATQTYTVGRVVTGNQIGSALRTSAFGNPDLKPERGEEFELGFDAGLFGERLGLDFTYYNKTTSDMLQSVALAPSLGFAGSRLTNLGEVINRGVELSVTGSPIQTPRVSWESRFIYSSNYNELVSFGIPNTVSQSPTGQAYGAVQQHRAGYPLGGYWAPNPRRNPDGSPVTNAAGAVQFDTAQYIGQPVPAHEFGFSNTLTLFRYFRFYALFDWKTGGDIFNLKERNRCQGQDNCAITNDPRARVPQTAADTLLMRELAVYRSASVAAYWIQPSDFVKLREVSLTIELPRQYARMMRVASANVLLSGRNLALWSDYQGIDPEVNSYGGRNFVRVDAYASPMTRRVSAGVNLTF